MKATPARAEPAERYRFGRFELQPAARRLLVDGQPAALGARALDVLLVLVERRGRLVGKDELLQVVWPGLVVEEANLSVQISALRKLLGPSLIATVAGRGYQFTGELEALAGPGAGAAGGPPGGGVPLAATRMVGREADLAALAGLLAEHRIVTLTGTGGIGKTRLAQGWCEGPGLGERVVWVELSGLSDPALLPTAVLAALGVASGDSALATLRESLAPLTLTLVLDNAEPMAGDVAALAQAVHDAAPSVRQLVTSQVPLRLQGEQVYRLGSLAIPDERVTPAQALQHGAVALFVERARAADPRFELVPGNVAAVVEICRRLDGLPLALELAAARVATLGVTSLVATLDERLRLLDDGRRDAPARQRTLRAALAWSHGLLDLRAQRVFRRLGVFAGGFTLDAAQAVVAEPDGAEALDAWAVMSTLGRLVESSLVGKDGGEPPRFGLLESARIYALEQLERAGEAALLRERHLAWCVDHVGRLLPPGLGALDDEQAAAIASEYANLRAALAHAFAAGGGDHAAGAALAVALLPYWRRVDDAAERQRWLPGPAAVEHAAEATQAEATALHLLDRLRADGVVGEPVPADAAGPTLVALASRLGADGVTDAAQASLHIEQAVARAEALLAGAEDAALDGHVADVLGRLEALHQTGDVDRGAQLLDGAFAELERRDARHRTALARARRTLLEAGIRNDLSRHDAFAAARRIEALAALDAPERPTESAPYLEREARMLAEGRRGDTLSLSVAAELLRRRLAAPQDAVLRAETVARLASVTLRLASLDADAHLLEEALELCTETMASTPRAEHPLAWAALMHERAALLGRLGEIQRSPERLAEAIGACREALKERRRDRAPLDWAASQAMLGRLQGVVATGETGTSGLELAVATLREALKEYTRHRAPLEWAKTQREIGVVLSMWGHRDGGEARLHEAAAAFRAALSEVARDRTPMEWAALQADLGIALAGIGKREPGLGTLQAAVDAYRAALREIPRERAPVAWAAAQHNLGGALRLLGERESGTQSLREAVIAFGEALGVHRRDRVPQRWAASKNDLALALKAIGRREGRVEALEAAVAALGDALLERRRDKAPFGWATTQVELSDALWLLGSLRGDAGLVEAAAQAAESALQELSADDTPADHAEAKAAVAQARGWLAARAR